MRVLFVHGRAQGGKVAETLKKTWVDALNEGLRNIGRRPLHESDVTMPFYGDTLDDLVPSSGDAFAYALEGNAESGSRQSEAQHLFADMLREIEEARLPRSSRQEDRLEFRSTLTEQEWIQTILRRLESLDGVAVALLKQFAADAMTYLLIEDARRVIDDEFRSAVERVRPHVVVAHSLGAVIMYNVLQDADLPVAGNNKLKLITVGSPIAMNVFKRRLGTLKHPPTVWRWLNAYDERDYIALYPTAPPHFDIDPAAFDVPIINDVEGNRHDIRGYLRNEIVAAEVQDALSRAHGPS